MVKETQDQLRGNGSSTSGPSALSIIPKTQDAKNRILKAMTRSTFLSQYEEAQKIAVIDFMFSKNYLKGSVILQKGSMAYYFVVVERGQLELLYDDKIIEVGPGDYYGDGIIILYEIILAFIMRPSTSPFTVRAMTDCTIWMIDSKGFHVESTKVDKYQTSATINMLREVPLLSSLTIPQLQSLSSSLSTECFQDNEYIIKKGEVGTKFYIIKLGVAICLGENSNMKRRMIETTSIFSPLKTEEKDQLVSYVNISNYNVDSYVFHENEMGEEIFIVEKGEAVCTKLVDNRECIIRRIKEGDHFGEGALYKLEQRTYNVKATTSLTVLSIKREDFVKILGSYQKLVERNNMEDFVNSIQFFGSMKLPVAAQEKLIKSSTLKKYAHGDVIIRQGDPPSSFYIIESGSVHCYDKVPITLTKANYFGEQSLLSLEPQKYTVKAIDDVTLLIVDQKTFFEIIQPLLYKLEDLEYVSVLGLGGFAVVRKVLTRNKKRSVFALKIVSKTKLHSDNSRNAIINEKQLCSQMNHPFLTRLITTFQDVDFVYMLQEYVEAGDLRTLMIKKDRSKFNENETRFFAAIIIQGLEHLHLKKIVYRDLKPENIMFCSNGYLKICDFGNAKIVEDRTYTICGTPDYMAPEIWLDRGHGIPCDYWAYGVLVYEFLNGETPFESKPGYDQSEQIHRIIKCKINYPPYFSIHATDFIKGLLKLHPTQRLGCMKGGCNDIREHPFFTGLNFNDLMNYKIRAPFIPNEEYLESCCTSFNDLTESEIRDTLIDNRYTYKQWIEGF